VVVTFFTGDPELCRRMTEEVKRLVPDRRHFVATRQNWPQMRRELRHIASAWRRCCSKEANALRRAAYRQAP
jgi:hypothetical protein